MAACAQDTITLQQAASYQGRAVTVRAQIAAGPIWAFGIYYVPLRDSNDYGLILRGDLERFTGFEPGDWIEARGKIESFAGLPEMLPDSMEKVSQSQPPSAKTIPLSAAANARDLGLLVESRGTVIKVSENPAGTVVQLSDRGTTGSALLPRSASVSNDLLTRIHVGDRVIVSGLLTPASQILLPAPSDMRISSEDRALIALLVLGMLAACGLLFWMWWKREQRMKEQHANLRTFHSLCEEIIAAPSPSEIAERLMTVLPSITHATGVWLYIFNRRTKSLERVPTESDPEPMVVPIETPADEERIEGAAVCFQERKPLNIPDVRRSQYLNTRTKQNSPRSAMIVPLTTQGDVLGVLEAGNANRVGYFSLEEQASIQHLANQVATALKLQEQRTIREQLFCSEKLAATGQLISGVANELRAPLESILHLATSLAEHHTADAPVRDLRLLAGESRRASEIVSRLVSFARPAHSEARTFDMNALLSELVQFREPEWRVLELRLQNRLAPEPAFVMGSQGQIEQVLLNLLVHAEQSAVEVPSKTLSIATSTIAGRVLVEIGYSMQGGEPADPFAESRVPAATTGAGALSLDVCRSVIDSHGGGMRFSTRAGLAFFELELPLIRTSVSTDPRAAQRTERMLTVMLVDPDPVPQKQLLGLLSLRGHRVVPVAAEEAADMAQRLRFDAVLWAMRLSGPAGGSKWSEFQERARGSISALVLVSDGYDAELARSIEKGGNYLLGRPIQESELDRILRQIETRTPAPARR